MTVSMLPVLEVLQEAAGSTSTGWAPPFSITAMGKALYTISFSTLVTASVLGRAAWRLRRGGGQQLDLARRTIDLGLFWATFTLALGFFHVFMSLTSTTYSVQMYGPLEPDRQWLVWRGLMLAAMAGAYGLLTFLVSAITWLGLRRWHRKLEPSTS